MNACIFLQDMHTFGPILGHRHIFGHFVIVNDKPLVESLAKDTKSPIIESLYPQSLRRNPSSCRIILFNDEDASRGGEALLGLLQGETAIPGNRKLIVVNLTLDASQETFLNQNGFHE